MSIVISQVNMVVGTTTIVIIQGNMVVVGTTTIVISRISSSSSFLLVPISSS